MTKITRSLLMTALLTLGLHAAPAHALLSRTAVSAAKGNDANNCDVSTPCRTFQVAHDNTNDQGEITVLDPGGYGSLTITKSISIVNDGVGEASILVSGGAAGITINAGVGGYVNLRGITIQGIGFGGGIGLQFNTGFSLTMENCVIRNHTGFGISFNPTGNSNLSVSNTLVADNGAQGIDIVPFGSGTVKVALNRVEAYNNSTAGINVNGGGSTGTINVTVTDSASANNANYGFFIRSTAGHASTSLMVVRSVAANNGIGLNAEGGATATLWVSQSTVTGNGSSWVAGGGGILQSFGDNNIVGNSDGNPAPPTIAKK
jgi:hypothetical protein